MVAVLAIVAQAVVLVEALNTRVQDIPGLIRNLVFDNEPSAPSAAAACDADPARFELSEPPYTNYFYSDCNSASQVIITSPLESSNLRTISPRLLVAWPAGNSGLAAYFQPQSGVDGSLSISLAKSSSTGNTVDPVFDDSADGDPTVGIISSMHFNSSATLTVPLMGSIRTLRSYTEARSLTPEIQDAIHIVEQDEGGFALQRTWFDNVTISTLSFTPSGSGGAVSVKDGKLQFEAGTYRLKASFNYPQLQQLSPDAVLKPGVEGLIAQDSDQALALSFLSYSSKMLAGAWRFLTYFGRDSMISILLLEPVLRGGEDSAFEAGITAVLERINRDDGTVAHEETIGDFATLEHLRKGEHSTSPIYDYKMIDTDLFLPIVLADYFDKNSEGKDRMSKLLEKTASENPANSDLTYGQLFLLTAKRIMDLATPFASPGGQTVDNLLHLKQGQSVGEWRDSNTGLGGGRVPYDVNTALVPAALRAIARLSEAGLIPEHPEWSQSAGEYAQIWEDETLRFFEVKVAEEEAKSLVERYVSSNNFEFPSSAGAIDSDVLFYGVSLGRDGNQEPVRIMNTDDCFRHFLLNTTNQTQLSSFLSQTADHILRPFPVGLSSDVGLLVANPAYAGDAGFTRDFTNSNYHGTVVWSWQLSMMAAGLERQLARCNREEGAPGFCGDETLYDKVSAAYHRLWDLIDANSVNLGREVWSWRYQGGKFVSVPLGELTSTESNIRQLWSLTFLAVKRNENLGVV